MTMTLTELKILNDSFKTADDKLIDRFVENLKSVLKEKINDNSRTRRGH